MRRKRPDPGRLKAFWIRGVFAAVFAVTAAVLVSDKAADAGTAGWPIAAAGFASGAAFVLVLRAFRGWWRSLIARFPRITVIGAAAVAAAILFWSAFGARAQVAMLAFGCGLLAVSAAATFLALTRTRTSRPPA